MSFYSPRFQPGANAGQGPLPGQQTAPANQNQPSMPMPQAQGPNPLQPPTFNPTLSGFNTDPSAVLQQILAAFQPQAASANRNFMDTMALSGLSGGPVQSGEAQLQGQLAAGLAPSLGNAIQFSQGQGLEQALANAGFMNQGGMFNTSNMIGQQDLLAQMLQQAWSQQLGAQTGLLGQGMGGAQGIAQGGMQNFPIQTGTGEAFSGLGGMLGGMWGGNRGGGGSPYQAPIPTPPGGFNPYNPNTSQWGIP